jgi:hypothetical protein
MKNNIIGVVLMSAIIIYSFNKIGYEDKVQLDVYEFNNVVLKNITDSIIVSSISCDKFPKNKEWYISCRAINDSTASFEDITVSVVNKDYLFSYTDHKDIKGLIYCKNYIKIYLINGITENLLRKTVNSIIIDYKNLKDSREFNIKPISEFPVWNFKYCKGQFIQSKFNTYNCDQWDL